MPEEQIIGMVKLTDIEFGERRRGDYGDVEELAKTIKERGLIQPLAVMRQPNCPLPYKLLAGGRRYMALTLNGADEVPVRIYSADISEFELRSIELAENFYRKDLTWEEEVSLKREIHELHIAEHGEKVSTSPDAAGWSVRDTAELIGGDRGNISRDLKLANALAVAPTLFAGCKTKSDASKVMKKITEQALLEEMSRRVAPVSNTAINKKNLMDCYILKDVFAGLAEVESGSMSFVELDPPYGINLHDHKQTASSGGAKATAEYNEVTPENYPAFMQQVLKECYRALTQHAWMVVWFAPEPWFEPMYQWITDAGFTAKRMCGIWTKGYGQCMQPATSLSNTYEMFFICKKGDPVLVKQGRSNVFSFEPVTDTKKIHPTERPVPLITEILNTFTTPGARVLVPFLGSGNTLIAAHRSSMTGFGFDITKEYKDRYMLKINSMED